MEYINFRRGFTLLELIVVIGIISILALIGVPAFRSIQEDARNAKRKSDLKTIQKSLESFKLRNNDYPTTVVGAARTWRTSCANPTDYVQGLTTGGFIEKLPIDPRNGKINTGSAFNTGATNCTNAPTWNCYYYSSDGTDYKLLAHCTPEGTLSATDDFYDSSRASYSWAIHSSPRSATW